MSSLPVSTRLLPSYLLVAVLPLGGLAAFHPASFETSLRGTVLANMAIIADKKADQIDTYMSERLADVRQLSRRDLIRKGIASLEQAFRAGCATPGFRSKKPRCRCRRRWRTASAWP